MPLQILLGPTIEAGESLSEPFDCTDGRLVRIETPQEWTGANLTYQLSTDGVDYTDLVDATGREIMHPVVPATTVVMALDSPFVPAIRYVKFRSGSKLYPISQKARRQFKLSIDPTGPSFTPYKFNTVPGLDGTALPVSVVTGATEVIVMITGSGAASLTTPTAVEIVQGIPLWVVGDSYRFRLCNPVQGAITLLPGSGVTITGLPSTSANTWREYLVRYIGPGSVDFRDIGSGNA